MYLNCTSSIWFTHAPDDGTYTCNVMMLETKKSLSVVLGPFIEYSFFVIVCTYICNIACAPISNVNVTSPNTQIVGQSCTLDCSVTTEKVLYRDAS